MLTSQGSGYPSAVPQSLPKNLFRFGEIALYSTHGYGSSSCLRSPGGNEKNAVSSTMPTGHPHHSELKS